MDNALFGTAAGLSTTTFAYAGSAHHLRGLGSLGFASSSRVSEATNKAGAATFSQDYAARTQGHKLTSTTSIASTGVVSQQVTYVLESTQSPTTPGLWQVRRRGGVGWVGGGE